MKKVFLLISLLLGITNAVSQETINTMFYNLLEFPEAPPSNRADILKTIIDDYQPDLFMVCELQSNNGANIFLNTSLQTADNRYQRANFVANQSSASTNLQQLVFYNTHKLILDSQDEIITMVRDINHYAFRLNTPDAETNPIYLDVYVAHLKSSQGSANVELRASMASELTNALESIPTDHYVLFAGDFNLYTANESAYQELLDPTNAIPLKDPINRLGSWHVNASFQDIHTQSTRTSNSNFNNFGAGGGLDDRFDFILISENLENDATLHYVTNSYKAYGNNGNCFNGNINDTSCSGSEYSQTTRNNLYNMSDHLPVVMQLQTDQVLNLSENLLSNYYIEFKSGNIISNTIALEIDARILGSEGVIYNSIGQKIKTLRFDKTNLFIDATNLSGGIYYIVVKNSLNNNPLKFIKL